MKVLRERILRSLLRGMRANKNSRSSAHFEDSLQLAAGSFKPPAAPSAPAARSGLSAIGSAWWWLAAGLYALAIFLLAGQSYPLGIKHLPFLLDKVIHVLVYGSFSAVLFAALRHSRPQTPPWVLSGLAAALAVLYGVSDEYHQAFVPFRRTDIQDLAADALGVLAAQCLVLWRAAIAGRVVREERR